MTVENENTSLMNSVPQLVQLIVPVAPPSKVTDECAAVSLSHFIFRQLPCVRMPRVCVSVSVCERGFLFFLPLSHFVCDRKKNIKKWCSCTRSLHKRSFFHRLSSSELLPSDSACVELQICIHGRDMVSPEVLDLL